MTNVEKSRTYDASLFNAPEFDARFEQKTKFYHIQLQGSNLATQWGKVGAEKPQGVQTFKHPSHEDAMQQLAKLIKEKTTGKGKYELKEEKGSRQISEVALPETRTSGRKKKATPKAEEHEGEEAVAGHKRGRGAKKSEEEKKLEEHAAAGTTGESDPKRQKVAEAGGGAAPMETGAAEQLGQSDVAKAAAAGQPHVPSSEAAAVAEKVRQADAGKVAKSDAEGGAEKKQAELPGASEEKKMERSGIMDIQVQ